MELINAMAESKKGFSLIIGGAFIILGGYLVIRSRN